MHRILWLTIPSLIPQISWNHTLKNVCTFLQVVPPYYRYLMKQSLEEKEEAKEEFIKHMKVLAEAKSKGGPFFTGDEFGMVRSEWSISNVHQYLVGKGIQFMVSTYQGEGQKLRNYIPAGLSLV